MRYALTTILTGFVFTACSASEGKTFSDFNDLMWTEFLEHCQARPEYISRKRAGTLDKYCLCVFDRTMKGLTKKERITAGFYLYGETSEGYMDRHSIDVQDVMHSMMPAAQAIDKAVKSCR